MKDIRDAECRYRIKALNESAKQNGTETFFPSFTFAMNTPNKEPARKRPPLWVLNTMTALVGLLTLAAGVGWVIYKSVVDLEIPYFAIPLVMCVPVIVAVAFRNIWD